MRRSTPWLLVIVAACFVRGLGGCFFSIPDLATAAITADAGARDGATPLPGNHDGSTVGPEGGDAGHFCSGFDTDGGWCADFDDGEVPAPFQVDPLDPGAHVGVEHGELLAGMVASADATKATVSVSIPGYGDTHVEMTIALSDGRLDAGAGYLTIAILDAPALNPDGMDERLELELVGGMLDNRALAAIVRRGPGGPSRLEEGAIPFTTATRHHVVLDIASGRNTVQLDGMMIFDQPGTPGLHDDARRTLTVGAQRVGSTPAAEVHIDDLFVRFR